MYKLIKKTFDINQLNWLQEVIMKKNQKSTSEFVQYIEQFAKDTCTLATITVDPLYSHPLYKHSLFLVTPLLGPDF